jgi:hypothetical protein
MIHERIKILSSSRISNSMATNLFTSAKCNSVRQLQAILMNNPVALCCAAKYFHMLIAPPGGLHCAVTHSKSIGWYS